MAEALISPGIALARLGKAEQSKFILRRAIEVAQQVDALNVAGMAALTLIEELDDLSIQTLALAYERANQWLAESQSQNVHRRMRAAAIKVLVKV